MLTKQVRELERQADEALANAARVNNRLKVSDLKPGYSVFGNKGNVWSDTAHIYESGNGNLDAGRKLIDDELAKVYNIIDIMNKLNN
jgi:hypothetical protein